MEFEMEEVDCPICGESRGDPFHLEGSFQMVRCSSCQFVFLNPRPTAESLHHFYQTYLPDEESSIDSWEKMMKPVFHRAANLIKRYGKSGRLLDVGSGFGFFVAEMENKGWEAVGVEISQRALDYARNILALAVRAGPLEKVGFPDSHFDAVTGFYVIEHLPFPKAFLGECHRILKPGGLLVLRYPHTTPIKNLLRFLGVKNRLYDLPAHLCDFSPKMIQQCLERIGFEKCKHLIGGYTVPGDLGKRTSSVLFGSFAEALFHLSGKKFLFPGVSKTILAFKR
ncbi:MAG TPA: class I SAM-dependent methyltransferase [Thermodesulfobacteriota bacterium]|nr:class I SAM-dependent methyltransferase [Thermodesulfobacteriota bacterium]